MNLSKNIRECYRRADDRVSAQIRITGWKLSRLTSVTQREEASPEEKTMADAMTGKPLIESDRLRARPCMIRRVITSAALSAS
jgi:hypothetical protein